MSQHVFAGVRWTQTLIGKSLRTSHVRVVQREVAEVSDPLFPICFRGRAPAGGRGLAGSRRSRHLRRLSELHANAWWFGARTVPIMCQCHPPK